MTQNPLEIPQQIRDLTKRNLDQSQAAFDQFMDAMAGVMEMWSKGGLANPMTTGFKTIQDRTMTIAKQNADSSFALANDVANAKDFQEVLSLQSKYAQAQMQSYALQGQELSQLMTQAVQGLMPKK